MNGSNPSPPDAHVRRSPAATRGRWKLWAVLAVCAAPLVAALLLYYVFPPSGPTTNYGTLIEPQRPVAGIQARTLAGETFDLSRLGGRWVMLQVDGGACDADCAEKLHLMRQLRTATGKERDRVERLWLVDDRAPVADALLQAYDGTVVARADAGELARLLPVEPQAKPGDYVYLIDPLGHLMMRFPASADTKRMLKDLNRLLKASRIG